ncbi:toluene-4-monooxygenase system B family protein [Amycolatopsis rubida]|uniref:Toluene monooxygenase system protein B n=1 Tax=Amycolatopsis rubida TaxID=112413 RepID=A0A1I5NCY8_9PSEU|nr:toluene-4-monooxygenase system B family protein [Amycolatopsis rubida]SFP19644.1 toluene monooxygenase system protein B [Amycolatopsis rubida]
MTDTATDLVAETGGTAAEPQLVPVNAIFADDFTEILVPVMSNCTMTEVAGLVAHHVEGRRVRARDLPKAVFHHGREVPADVTVAQAGIGPMDHIRVDYQEQD